MYVSVWLSQFRQSHVFGPNVSFTIFERLLKLEKAAKSGTCMYILLLSLHPGCGKKTKTKLKEVNKEQWNKQTNKQTNKLNKTKLKQRQCLMQPVQSWWRWTDN